MTSVCSSTGGRDGDSTHREPWNLIRPSAGKVGARCSLTHRARGPATKACEYAGHQPLITGGASWCSAARVSPSWPASLTLGGQLAPDDIQRDPGQAAHQHMASP